MDHQDMVLQLEEHIATTYSSNAASKALSHSLLELPVKDKTTQSWLLWRSQLQQQFTENFAIQRNLQHLQINRHKQETTKALRALLAKKPKKGHNLIMKDAQTNNIEMLLDATGRTVTKNSEINATIHDFYHAMATARQGKNGRFFPDEAPRDYPWSTSTAEVPETYQLEFLATDNIMPHDVTLPHVADETIFLERLHCLPNNKAPGPDGIPNELLKHLPNDLKECIHKLFIIMYATGVTPTTWKQSTTVLLAKPGCPLDLKNKRPIALANCLYKLYTSIVTPCYALTHFAEEHNIISPVQEGFRRFHNAHRQARQLIHIIKDAELTSQNLYALYVDFSSAFNCVDHDKLLCIMYDLGFPTLSINVVWDIYTNSITRISTNAGLTDPIQLHRGTLQGDSLSRFLFLVFIEPLLRWLQCGGRGYQYGCLKGGDPMLSHRAAQGYADDLRVLAPDSKSRKVQTSKVTAYNKWSHLDANAKKCAPTAILHGDAKAGIVKKATDFTRIHSQLQSINICCAPIPCIPPDMPYKYLGLQQTLTLNWRHQVAGVIKLLKDKGDRLVR